MTDDIALRIEIESLKAERDQLALQFGAEVYRSSVAERSLRELEGVTRRWFEVQRGTMAAQSPSGKAVADALERIAVANDLH